MFKIAASLIFAFGVVLHSCRLAFGFDWVQRYLVTPPLDIVFGFLILLAAVPGTMVWKRYSGGRGLRRVYGFAMFMLWLSVPIHLRTIFTWSTDYVRTFGAWYSMIEVPMFAALSYCMTRLQFDGEKPGHNGQATI
jgi:hypothetical protein